MKFRDRICLSIVSKRIISSISIPCFFPLRRQAIISLSLVTKRSPSRNSCCVAWPTKKNVCELRPGKNFCMTFLITWIYPTSIFWKFSRISIHANELSGDRWEEINFSLALHRHHDRALLGFDFADDTSGETAIYGIIPRSLFTSARV